MDRLDLVVGPHGAGESTFVELTLAPLLPRSVVVNADEIAADPAAYAPTGPPVTAETTTPGRARRRWCCLTCPPVRYVLRQQMIARVDAFSRVGA